MFSGVVPTMDFVETASSNASSEDLALLDESPKQHSLDGFYPSHDTVSCHSCCYLDSHCLCACTWSKIWSDLLSDMKPYQGLYSLRAAPSWVCLLWEFKQSLKRRHASLSKYQECLSVI